MARPPDFGQQPAVLRGAAFGTFTPLSVIQQETEHSRNWTRVLADSLANQGFLEKRFLPRAGPGRPTAAYALTPPGQKMLDAFIEAEASRFVPAQATAGPVWSLAHYGLPFAGQKDAFVQHPGQFLALLEVPGPAYVLEDPRKEEGVNFPAPERLALWLLESRDERYVLAAPFLLRDHALDWALAWALAAGEQIAGRLAYVLAATDQRTHIPTGFRRPEMPEELVRFGSPGPDPLGTEFNVTGTIPGRRFQEFEAVYRGEPA